MQATVDVSKAGAGPSLSDDLLALLIHLLKSSSHDVFAAVGELDLSMTQVKMLHVLEASDIATEGQPVKALAERLGISLPAASRAVEGLHARGLVERREDESDRRMKRIAATADGREIVGSLNRARLEAMDAFIATVSTGEQKALRAALAPIVARPEIAACRLKGSA